MSPLRTYTTCATCEQRLQVQPATPPGHHTHPDCPPATDPASVLRRDYLAAIERGADETELRRREHELDTYDGREPQLLYAALQYAAWGWPVFPCVPGLKRPATGHGFKQATTDPERIKDWWWRWPRANIAVATGRAFDVIDIDPAGIAWWRDHGHEDGPLPDIHGIVSTPRLAGMHLYIRPTGLGNKSGVAPGVDFRGNGGYVLMPPSVLTAAAYDHKDGAPPPVFGAHLVYTWAIYPSPDIKPAVTP